VKGEWECVATGTSTCTCNHIVWAPEPLYYEEMKNGGNSHKFKTRMASLRPSNKLSHSKPLQA